MTTIEFIILSIGVAGFVFLWCMNRPSMQKLRCIDDELVESLGSKYMISRGFVVDIVDGEERLNVSIGVMDNGEITKRFELDIEDFEGGFINIDKFPWE